MFCCFCFFNCLWPPMSNKTWPMARTSWRAPWASRGRPTGMPRSTDTGCCQSSPR